MSIAVISCSVHKQVRQNEEIIITGKITRNTLAEKISWFEKNYQTYKPNDSAIHELNKYSKNLKVIVVMGTWCEDSKQNVPAFFKVADKIFMEENQYEIIGVDRDKKCKKPDITKYKIKNVPTFILYLKGEEIGSIIETPKESIEKDMLRIIKVMTHKADIRNIE